MNLWEPIGLYDPRWEHDACGIGFVAYRDGRATHSVVAMALTALTNLQHRGGTDADGKSGDGAGVLTQLPYALLAAELDAAGRPVPARDALAVAQCFLPADRVAEAQALIGRVFSEHGAPVLWWRLVPTDNSLLGARALSTKPACWQALVARPAAVTAGAAWERALYLIRRVIEQRAGAAGLDLYLPSLSSRTIVYKGLLAATALGGFYRDLRDERYQTALAVYHQRFSTNTLPTWERAQPFRLLSHNGEINTLAGNEAALRAREAEFEAPVWGDTIRQLAPVIDPRGSDSAKLDNTLELLVRSGRDICHSLAMLVPAAWEQHADLSPELQAFYRYHAGLMGAWDGPAALCFADGTTVGIALDRNGLRPVRFFETRDGLVVCGSEAGAVPVPEVDIIRKGRLGPGEIFAVRTDRGEVLDNDAIKAALAAQAPYAAWLAEWGRVWTAPPAPPAAAPENLTTLHTLFGYTAEDVQVILKAMARDGHEPVGSMGDDTPVGALTQVGRPLFAYLRQAFAQVTNPPIDPLREKLVMSVRMRLGHRRNLLAETPEHAHLLEIQSPILRDHELTALLAQSEFPAERISAVWPVASGPEGLIAAIRALQGAAVAAAGRGTILIVISDRAVDREHAPIPALLAVGAVHQALLAAGCRARTNIIAETGEARDVHQIACLIGNGSEAVQPYLALATARSEWLDFLASEKSADGLDPEQGERNYIAAVDEGLRKIMSKMGIATLDSYGGAQLFEALGIAPEVLAVCLPGIAQRLGGVGWAEIAADGSAAHTAAWDATKLRHTGMFKWKKDGEYHAHTPATVHALQAAVGLKPHPDGLAAAYRSYSELVHRRAPATPRDLLRPVTATPVELDEVEPITAILARFSTAAMSLGSTSNEAHSTLAVAMNRMGGLSNSGEGGEDPARFYDERNSAIKQVASGRFGVTPEYLMAAHELQIKMAQGSKPGEGGQLPGHKVTAEIARVRHTIPGVTLISPPPHHDIYSIEDLAQLIYDLKQINPAADISVKLVATAGVGTIAAGVVKAGADIVHVSGHSGGTGASPLSSIKYAGAPWELGLAETQQTLVRNGLRARVRLRTDGGLQTGRDVLVAALLGADEFSFGTTALIAEGCIMARACHNNTCPVGIATQRPELRAKFPGTPDNVIHFFEHLAQEVREGLAALGVRTLAEVVGRTELLERAVSGDPRADQLDVAPLLVRVDRTSPTAWGGQREPATVGALNAALVSVVQPALGGERVVYTGAITNVDRSVGATLAGVIARRCTDSGLPDDAVTVRLHGSAGQSFGAFNISGVRLELLGESNDYVGKGMSGGTITVQPVADATFIAADSAIIGNTVLYGATGGALWAAGRAGERFAVRNSGALAVVEGAGDHGCEYMTGGTVVVLGSVGRNFAAGMTGGLAYLWDADGQLPQRINPDMVRWERLSDSVEIADLRRLIVQHQHNTGSQRAAALLADWPAAVAQFWRVVPTGAPATLTIPQPSLNVAAPVTR